MLDTMILAATGDIQWGDVATWAGSVLAALAFAATIVVLTLQRRELELVRRDHLRQETEQRLQQARLVSFWIGERENVQNQAYRFRLHARNGSTEPVYNWRSRVFVEDESESVAESFHYVLAPGEEHTSPVEMPFDAGKSHRLRVEGEFSDSGNRRWVRRPDGRLVEQEENRHNTN